MNSMEKSRDRKKSLVETHLSGYVPPEVKYKRRRSFQGKHNSRDRDCFVPDQVEEWVLPEYRSLFHHLFLKEEEDSQSLDNCCEAREGSGGHGVTDRNSPPLRLRKVSRSDSGMPATPEEDGGQIFNNFTKRLPTWLKKVFNVSDNNEEQQQNQEMDRHAWLDEIPIEICDKLRHIHIYV